MTSCAFWVSSERSLCAALRAYVRVMRTTWISPVFLCLLATAPVAGQGRAEPNLRPGLQIVAQEERYVVEAETFQQMIAVLNGMRLEGERARLSQGLTVYRVVPRWRYQPGSGGCAMISAEVEVEITVKLPLWPGFTTASDEHRLRWQGILGSIREHEYEHRDITIDSASELLQNLFALRARTCRALNGAAEAALALAEEALLSRHAELDGS